jgi:sugar O-acyltransferase (sialic acid O-acetyltransferase NeuD family)
VSSPEIQNAVAVVGLESRYIHEVLDILRRSGRAVAAFLPSRHDAEVSADLPAPPGSWAWAQANPGAPFTVPLLTPGRRKRTVEEALAAGLRQAKPIVDERAVVSPTTVLGDGSVVNTLAAIGAWCRIGRQAQINRSASLGHDLTLGDFVTVGPNATVSGVCTLEDGVFVGAGATLAPKVRIGRNSIVGAGAVVTRDVPAHVVVVGNPARIVREGVAGYRDIGV